MRLIIFNFFEVLSLFGDFDNDNIFTYNHNIDGLKILIC